MATSLEDYIASDGILRSLLSKTLNNVPVPIYPKTSSDAVVHGDSNLASTLERIDVKLQTLSNSLGNTISDLTKASNSRYTKEDIQSLLTPITDSITDTRLLADQLKNTLDGLSYYSRQDVDTILSDVTNDISRNAGTIERYNRELNERLSSDFYDTSQITGLLNSINSRVDDTIFRVNQLLQTSLSSQRSAVNDDLRNTLANYYPKSVIDALDRRLAGSITTAATDIQELREDMNDMNTAGVADIKNHTADIVEDIQTDYKDKLTLMEQNIKDNSSNKAQDVLAKLQALEGNVASVNTHTSTTIASLNESLANSINARFDALAQQIANISSGGEGGGEVPDQPSVPSITYESADEEEY